MSKRSSKRPSKRTDDPNQLSLEPLFFEPPKTTPNVEGSRDISGRIREALGEVLSDANRAGKDRWDVATEISRLCGRDVSKNMLDRYTAQSGVDYRFPAEILPALCQATGDISVLDILAEACGCKVLRGEEAALAELGALMLQDQNTKARMKACKQRIPEGLIDNLAKRREIKG